LDQRKPRTNATKAEQALIYFDSI